jgi:hypothetical protein
MVLHRPLELAPIIMDLDRLKAAMNGSIRLSQAGQNQEALKLLDDAIADAIQEGRT